MRHRRVSGAIAPQHGLVGGPTSRRPSTAAWLTGRQHAHILAAASFGLAKARGKPIDAGPASALPRLRHNATIRTVQAVRRL